MAQINAITLAFLRDHPVSAAKALCQMTEANIDSVLNTFPANVVAPVVEHMEPRIVARALGSVVPGKASSLFETLSTSASVLILRELSEDSRQRLISALPRRCASSLVRNLTYDSSQVGAWVDQSTFTLGADCTVGDAISRFRSTKFSPSEWMAITDSRKCYVGIVELSAMLQGADSCPVLAVANTDLSPLPAASLLSKIQLKEEWHRLRALPVVGVGNIYLGHIAEFTIGKAPDAIVDRQGREMELSLVGEFSLAYLRAMSELINFTTDFAFTSKRNQND